MQTALYGKLKESRETERERERERGEWLIGANAQNIS